MNRRRFLLSATGALLTGLPRVKAEPAGMPHVPAFTEERTITLFVCGNHANIG